MQPGVYSSITNLVPTCTKESNVLVLSVPERQSTGLSNIYWII